MNYIIDSIKAVGFTNTWENYIYIFLVVFILWMYKELKSYLNENSKIQSARLDKALEIYGEAETEIHKYFNRKSDLYKVAEKLVKAYPFLPYDVLKKVLKWKEHMSRSNENLNEIYLELLMEIKKLKRIQIDPISNRSEFSVIEMISYYYKSKLDSLIRPLSYTTINLLVLLVIIFIGLLIQGTNEFTEKLFILSVLVDVICYIVFLDITINDVLFKKRFLHRTLNWLLYGLTVMIPALLFIWSSWYSGLIIILWIIGYMVYLAKKGLK